MPDLSWELFERQVAQCQMCGLCQNIHHKVPGQGDRHSPLMLIGEGPGQVEDEEGLAFVGPAGQLLTKMLAAISLPRDRVYICNVVKCRPPQNRVPTDEEAAAAKNIIGADVRITRDRGKWFERKGIWMMATYHPSALLRDPSKKRDAWEDMQSLRDRLMDLGLYNDIYQEQTP